MCCWGLDTLELDLEPKKKPKNKINKEYCWGSRVEVRIFNRVPGDSYWKSSNCLSNQEQVIKRQKSEDMKAAREVWIPLLIF